MILYSILYSYSMIPPMQSLKIYNTIIFSGMNMGIYVTKIIKNIMRKHTEIITSSKADGIKHYNMAKYCHMVYTKQIIKTFVT